MDAISLLTPHTKVAIRPTSPDAATIASAIQNAYRVCWYGRPGPTFVDLPGDLIMEPTSSVEIAERLPKIKVANPPKPAADPQLVETAAALLRNASSPLVIIGKGSAYARAEVSINKLIDNCNLPFLPTPMGKGVVSDAHPLNTSSARSVALKSADVILLLGARLNWILHYGDAPKYRKDVKIIQVDISAEELGRPNNIGEPHLSIFGDIGLAVEQLLPHLSGWKAFPQSSITADASSGSYLGLLAAGAAKNEQKAETAALTTTKPGAHLTFERAFHIIKQTLHSLSPPEDGEIVYIGEGSKTMDISRSIFPLSKPRQKLDAGTYATMGLGPAYCVAAWAAYNLPQADGKYLDKRKKVVAFEGDSAIGFSAAEIETMARHKMDILVFVMNNSGISIGDVHTEGEWRKRQDETVSNQTTLDAQGNRHGLRSTSLLYETRYEKLAEMVGGKGYFVRNEDELTQATREGFQANHVVVVNVIIEPGLGKTMNMAWQMLKEQSGQKSKSRL